MQDGLHASPPKRTGMLFDVDVLVEWCDKEIDRIEKGVMDGPIVSIHGRISTLRDVKQYVLEHGYECCDCPDCGCRNGYTANYCAYCGKSFCEVPHHQ